MEPIDLGQGGRAIWILGLMSGTSLDGIDAALVQTDGVRVINRAGFLSIPYTQGQRDMLTRLVDEVRKARLDKTDQVTKRWPEEVAAIAQWHAEAVKRLLSQVSTRSMAQITLGFHGQTVDHRPDEGVTLQVGDAAVLSALTGLDTVHDFRSLDVENGGQGAPLAPLYHATLAPNLDRFFLVNVGGVANATYIHRHKDGTIISALDTGPGNGLLDEWCQRHTGQNYDADGLLSRAGRVDDACLKALLANPYFSASLPKSLDRHDFSTKAIEGLSIKDGAATLVAFTAETIARGLDLLGSKAPVLIAGGGRHNPTLMAALESCIKAPVDAIETLGLDGDAIEAEAFAFLAARSMLGLPTTYPSISGPPQPLVTGRLVRA